MFFVYSQSIPLAIDDLSATPICVKSICATLDEARQRLGDAVYEFLKRTEGLQKADSEMKKLKGNIPLLDSSADPGAAPKEDGHFVVVHDKTNTTVTVCKKTTEIDAGRFWTSVTPKITKVQYFTIGEMDSSIIP